MAYSRTRRVASVCSLLLATLQLCSALHDNSNTSPPVPALVPRAVDDPDIAAAIAKYQETYACFERDDGQGPCFLEQCREACAFPKDRVPEDCHDNDVSRKWKREESEEKIPAIVGSVSCMIETEWQSADGSGEPIEGKRVRFGHCLCDDPAITIIGDFFIYSVKKVGEILSDWVCPGLLAFDIVLNAGIAAIPGVGQAMTAGMRVSIQVAKAFKVAYEGMDAASFFADFFLNSAIPSLAQKAGCDVGLPSKKDVMEKVYPPLSEVPDEIVPGINPDDLPCGRGGGRKKPNGQCERDDKEREPSNAPRPPPQNTQHQPSQTPAESEATPPQTTPPQTTPSQTNAPSATEPSSAHGSQASSSGSEQSLSSTPSGSHSESSSITSMSSSTVSACPRRTRSRRNPSTKVFFRNH